MFVCVGYSLICTKKKIILQNNNVHRQCQFDIFFLLNPKYFHFCFPPTATDKKRKWPDYSTEVTRGVYLDLNEDSFLWPFF